ncbi:hypothetical protein A1O3_04944 [Capronia epimyces CBS 606.96]|uniref:ER transporter 6TM N-terminal domain-containing protein n=1 Tax=Capronia epimyces CBS 606.96 TaxID=1182542 RepID=W9XUN7_9EURO|nr:uncharacterized protein A1O3_04944 [Capronia epimyces CBS 606.96]EXJ84277.1 hypothetical protein A1O3_04944 [Capronia epimyces CBS 606.96]
MSATDREPADEATNVEGNRAPPGYEQSDQNGDYKEEAKKSRPGLLKKVAAKINLDLPTFLMMLKGGASPAIALAAYQSDGWAETYSTLGYLVAILSVLSLPILPRGKFIQSMMTALFTLCLAAAMALLSIQCAVAARQGAQPTQYSAAANVTACVWLFFNLYVANAVRALRPQLFLVSIQYLIFIIVASTYAATFPNMAAGMKFVNTLLKTFLTGYALSTGVSLFLLPISSRKISYKLMTGVLNLMKECLNTQAAYVHAIATSQEGNDGCQDEHDKLRPAWDKPEAEVSMKQAEDAAKMMKSKLQQASQLFGQLKIEIGFAKKEIGWGKLRAGDFTKIWGLLQSIFLPITGLSTFVDILESVKNQKAQGTDLISNVDMVEAIRRLEADEWREIIVLSRGSFQNVRASLIDGLAHICYVLELRPRPKATSKDPEMMAGAPPAPGDPKFGEHLEAQIKLFEVRRQDTMRRWCEKKKINVPAKFWDDPMAQYNFTDSDSLDDTVRQKHNHQQLYLMLYLDYLLYSICLSVLNMVHFADSKVQDGTMKKNRLIFPGWRRIRKLMQSGFMQADSDQGVPDGEATGIIISLGASLSKKKDPEHLPPTTWYQRATGHLNLVPKFLGSPESAFGFRVAVASISVAIIGFIHQTSHFYLAQRGIWAVIMVAISMGPTAGVGVSGFIGRVLGTAVATAVSIAIWYMSDQKPAAIIPLSYVYFVCCYYIVFKKPKHIITAVISAVTVILIVGYELQDRKIGTKLLTSNGQEYYRIYLLAPYRLASVVAGIVVAFIWTYFPYPITTHATLRKDLGATLYLMANYYSITHSTVETKLRHGSLARQNDKSCPMRKLDKAREKVYEKIMVMMNRLREHSAFTVYEPTFGGKFPKQAYDELIGHMQKLFNYMALTSWSSQAFNSSPDGQESEWLRDFRRLTAQSHITSDELTSTLYLLSSSMSNVQPLPPYIRLPAPFDIAEQLSAVDPAILSTKHIDEPCYAAFAVLEIAGILIMQETAHVLAKIKELVGEVDFSVHLIDTKSNSAVNSTDKLSPGPKGKAD